MTYFFFAIGVAYYVIAILFALNQSRKRTIHFIPALLIVVFLPLLGIFIVESFRQKGDGCKWCGNKYNEAEFCFKCKKNAEGEYKKELQS